MADASDPLDCSLDLASTLVRAVQGVPADVGARALALALGRVLAGASSATFAEMNILVCLSAEESFKQPEVEDGDAS